MKRKSKILNCGFYKNLLRGKYGPFRIFQMLLAFLAVLSMAGAMIVPALQTKAGRFALRTAGILFAAYGGYAFIKRDIGLYMTLQNMFAFFDFEEPLVFFILDYLAVMGLFV